MIDGILNINKSRGKTSFDIVALVKRLTGERRVGHAGTLDPEATGVLPICIGQGTRVTEFLTDSTKTYQAEIELGVTTDTYDATGKITQRQDPSSITREQLETALSSFCGSIQQTPPMYSAVKHHGKRLYELARAGIEVERKSRTVKIYRIEFINWQPPLATVEVECGKGTYIRSLAHDLGQVLGCGANLKSLVRLKCGIFDIKDALSLAQFEDACCHGHWQRYLYPIDIVFSNWASVIVSLETGQAIRNGCPLPVENCDYQEPVHTGLPATVNRCCVYTPDGCFLGILRFDPEKAHWQPEKIFPSRLNPELK